MKVFTLLSSILISLECFAYIPHFDMILSRVSRNRGYGFYFIEQEVVFPNEPTPLVVKEHWTIQSDNRIKLRVYGQGSLENQLLITFVYANNKKYYLDEGGSKKVSTKYKEWIHPYLFFREVKNIKTKLFVQKIIPSSALKEKRLLIKSDGSAETPEQKFVKLTRSGGDVTYFVGSPSKNEDLKPGLWLVQDQFHIKKLRLPTNVEFTASGYTGYTRGFWLPKTQVIHWDDNFIQVNLRRVKTLSGTKSLQKKLLHTSLDPENSKDLTQIPNFNKIKEFYIRFR